MLDVGGGDGLLCRLLRDYELNSFVHDKYASPTYAQGFDVPDFTQPDMIVAFEVIEHYPEPRKDLEELLSRRPKAVLASTGIFALLRSGVRRFTKARLAMSSAAGVWKDHQLQVERAKSRPGS